MIERINSTGAGDANSSSDVRADTDQLMDQGTTHLDGGSDSRRRDSEWPRPSARPRTSNSSDEFPIPSGHATDPVDPVESLNLGHLSLEDGGKSR